MTGKHPVGAAPSKLVRLMPKEHEELYAELHGEDGALSWRMEAPGGRARRPAGVVGTGAFDFWDEAELRAMLVCDQGRVGGLGAERMRRAVMERFGTLEKLETPVGFNPMQAALWDKAIAECHADDPSSQLSAMQKWFKKAAKEANDGAASLAESIERAKADIVDVGGEDILPMLVQQLSEAQRAKAHAKALDDINKALEALPEEKDNTETKAEIARLEKSIEEHDQSLTVDKAFAILLERAKDSTCPCCGSHADLAAMQSELEQRRVASAAEKKSYQERISVLRASLPAEEGKRERLIQEREKLEKNPPSYTGPSCEDLEAQVDAIKLAKKQRENIAMYEEKMHKSLDAGAAAKLLQAQTTTLLTSYLSKLANEAAAAVNRYMPEGFEAKLHVTETECEWRMVGSDGRDHPAGAFSGSEGGVLEVARAQAWAEGAPFKLVLLDDVDFGVFDPMHFRALLTKFHESVREGRLDQVVVAWTRPNEIPDDWHVVSC